MTDAEITIAGRRIGAGQPPYVICELSANHNGSLERMLALVDAAAATGCDAIKIQTYRADTMTIDCDRPEFRIDGGLWDGRLLFDLYEEASTPYEWHPAIFERARQQGVTLFSTPFDGSAVDLLASLDAPAYKIASFELTDLALIAKAAAQGKPLIMSTGLASLSEIDAAVRCAREAGCAEILLLHCVSSYPAPADDSNLKTIPALIDAFGLPVGLSDHTQGYAVAVAAVALGAVAIEKHFTLDRASGGPDAAFSLEPIEFASLCQGCRYAFDALGEVNFSLIGQEHANVRFRRSIVAIRDIADGEMLSTENIRVIRPGYGLEPRYWPIVLGRQARRPLARGQPISWDVV